MNLTAEQFAELVLALNVPNVDPDATGRRRAIRAKIAAELLIEPTPENSSLQSGEQPLAVQVLDLSCGGLAIASPQALAANSSFLIRLRYQATMIHIIARVAHCKPAEGGQFHIGAEFTGVIAPSEDAARPGIAEQILDAMPQ